MSLVFVIFAAVWFISCYSFQTKRVPQWKLPSSSCHPNLCANAPGRYPANPNMYFYAEFDIPPLPTEFSGQQTYYIYYNINQYLKILNNGILSSNELIN